MFEQFGGNNNSLTRLCCPRALEIMSSSSQSVEIPSDISKDELLEAIAAIRKTREQKEAAVGFS